MAGDGVVIYWHGEGALGGCKPWPMPDVVRREVEMPKKRGAYQLRPYFGQFPWPLNERNDTPRWAHVEALSFAVWKFSK